MALTVLDCLSVDNARRLFAGTSALAPPPALTGKLIGRYFYYLVERANIMLLPDPTQVVSVSGYNIRRETLSEEKICSICNSAFPFAYWITNEEGTTYKITNLMVHVLIREHPSSDTPPLQAYHDFLQVPQNPHYFSLTARYSITCEYSKKIVDELERLCHQYGGHFHNDPDPEDVGIRFFFIPVKWDFKEDPQPTGNLYVYACSPKTALEYNYTLRGGIRVEGVYKGCHRLTIYDIP